MSAKLFLFRFSSENPELEAALHGNLVAAKSELLQDWAICITDLVPGGAAHSLEQSLLDHDAQFDDAILFLGAGARALTPGIFPLLEAAIQVAARSPEDKKTVLNLTFKPSGDAETIAVLAVLNGEHRHFFAITNELLVPP